MSVVPDRFVMVNAVDFSELTDVVIERGIDLAARHEQPTLHFLAVSEPRGRLLHRDEPSDDLAELERALRERVAETLNAFGHSIEDASGWQVYLHVRVGVPAEQIVDLAAEAEADMIVLGRHGEAGQRRFFVGSVPEKVLRMARCSVMVVQPADYGPEPSEPVEPPCPDCVAIRAETGGETWLCEQHRGDRLSRSATMIPRTGLNPGGMW